MSWIVESLMTVILKAVSGLFSILTIGIIKDIGINIGADFSKPTLGEVMGTMGKAGGDFFSTMFGQLSNLQNVIMYASLLMVLLFMIIKVTRSMLGPLSDAEHPAEIAGRSMIAAAGVLLSYKIFITFEYFGNAMYKGFLLAISNEERAASVAEGNFFTDGLLANGKGFISAWSDEGALGGIKWGVGNNAGISGIPLLIISLVCVIALLFAVFKIIFEIVERYVLLGVLFYTCPFAFIGLIEKGGAAFKSWLQMVLTHFIVMCLNLMFIQIGLLTMSVGWTNITHNAKDGVTSTTFLLFLFCLIAWFGIGTRIDQYIRTLGFSVGQTGNAIMGAMLGGALMVRSAAGAYRTLRGKPDKGETSGGGSPAKKNPATEEANKSITDRTGVTGKTPSMAAFNNAKNEANKAVKPSAEKQIANGEANKFSDGSSNFSGPMSKCRDKASATGGTAVPLMDKDGNPIKNSNGDSMGMLINGSKGSEAWQNAEKLQAAASGGSLPDGHPLGNKDMMPGFHNVSDIRTGQEGSGSVTNSGLIRGNDGYIYDTSSGFGVASRGGYGGSKGDMSGSIHFENGSAAALYRIGAENSPQVRQYIASKAEGQWSALTATNSASDFRKKGGG